MKHNDDAMWREWVDLDLDGALGSVERSEFERLEQSPEFKAERQQLSRLHTLLGEERIAVAPGFQEQVMAALPVASWETRQAERPVPVWALPFALVFAFGVSAAFLLGSSLENSQTIGIVATILDFLQTTTLAGAGLLFATWRGVGFGLSELFADSIASLAVFGVGVLGLNLLILTYLKRRREATVAVRRSDDNR